MKTCLIITGGSIDLTFAGSFLEKQKFDKVIAVDGGLEAVQALGLMPDAIVGDFDTVDSDLLKTFQCLEGITWDIHKPEKDETDTELALQTAFKLGCEELVILGAMGGRMDHGIGNIHLLYPCLEQGVKASIIDSRNRIYLLNQGKSFHRDFLWGKYISFLPLTWKVSGITLEGFKYPLYKKDISIGTSLCISNELVGENGRLSFDNGILICVESHD